MRKDALTGGTKNLRIDKHQEHLLCVKHWFKELDDPQEAAGPSQAFYLCSLFLGVSGSVGSSFTFRFSAFLTKIKIKQQHFSQKLST
jgi:hypothetical protein